ncbi:AAA family ATPase [uncultured Parabacteroides sp.]|uniref:AbiJ-related protein n=1 Tax=uncultured Parabacteroides sp. TaxID=512312 RepID=UPI002632BCB0|nr:AAA family ATPase [uncultured Parabacteroides sp.]
MTKTIFSPVQQKMLFNQIKESDFFNSLINDGNFFDFLSNIWDIDTLPSSDPRFNNLRGDIQQHMFNNDDWDYDYLFSEALQLFKKEDLFNKFITETVNPIYHNHDSQLILVATINEYLLPKKYILKPYEVDENGDLLYKIEPHTSIIDDSAVVENNIPFLLERRPRGYAHKISSHCQPNKFPSFTMVVDHWDDYGVESRFELFYYESKESYTYIGPLKIINVKQEYTDSEHQKYRVRDLMEDLFYSLGENEFCSIGQTQEYYDTLKQKFPNKYLSILWALKDCAIFSFIEDNFEKHPFFHSLIRENSVERILRKEKYLIDNRKISSCYRFSYEFSPKYAEEPIHIEFSFDINSAFQQRVFAIIGENGVGKTQLITALPLDLAKRRENLFAPQVPLYSKVIAVSTSLYDSFDVPKNSVGFNYVYCGLACGKKDNKTILAPKELKLKLLQTTKTINGRERAESLKNILFPLYSADIISALFTIQEEKIKVNQARLVEIVDYMSSGESSLLFIFCNIVANIRYDSLILFDEPETHLHPNAITSLMSSIYQLLDEYQSYAIIVTHSPLIIREMRSTGVRIMDRINNLPVIRSINMESLGANVSALVEEIFENKDIPKYYKIKIDELISLGLSYGDLISALQSRDIELGIGLKMYIQQRYKSHV